MVLWITPSIIPGVLNVEEATGTLLGPLSLKQVRYQQQGMLLTVDQLNLDWQSRALLSGQLRINSLQANSVAMTLTDQKKKQQAEAVSPEIDFNLPIDIDITNFAINQLSIQTAKAAEPIIIEQLTLAAGTRQEKIDIQGLFIKFNAMKLQASGQLSLQQDFPLELKTDYSYQLNKTQQLKSQGVIEGDLKKLHITQQLSGLLQAKLTMEVFDLVENLNWQVALKVTKFNVQDVSDKTPPIAVRGDVQAGGDLKNISLQGALDLGEKNIGVGQLQLNAKTNIPVTDYRFSLKGEFTGVEFPESSVDIQGQGDLQKLALSTLVIKTLNGKLEGTGEVSWAPNLLMNADLTANGLDPGVILKEWPGTLNAKLSLKSILEKGSPRFSFTIDKLDGVLREYPVQAKGGGNWYGDALVIDSFDLAIEQTRLHLRGTMAEKWDMRFSASSPNLKHILPDASGRFNVSGQVAGKRLEPKIELSGQASDLSYERESLKSLVIQVEAGLAKTSPLLVDIKAQDVVSRAGPWQSAILKATGNNDDHHLVFNTHNEQSKLNIALQGQFTPWQWLGKLEQLNIEQNEFGKWQLQSPTNLRVAENTFELKSLCLLQNSSYLCSEIEWDAHRRTVNLQGKALPLTLLKPLLPENIRMTGQVDLDAKLKAASRQAEYDGMLKIRSQDKSIAINFVDLNEKLTLAASEISATLDSKSLQANLHIPLSEGGGIESDLRLIQWSLERPFEHNQPVQARLIIDRIPADTITRFIPEIARAQGHLSADFSVKGTLAEPLVSGKANWQNGSVILPELGISVREITTEIESSQTNVLNFRLHARSGKGDVELKGQTRLDPGQGWPTKIQLSSQNLEVMNIPEAYVLVDSNVDVAIQGVTINISGEVTVPRARLRPRSLPEGTAGLSRDAVIINTETAEERPTRWLVSTRLRVKMGELVDFDGFGVNGKFKGSLLLIDEPDKLPTGQGMVSIDEGIYRLRGQDLKIRRGRLIYADTFIDDPAVDVDAVREINNVIVGVRLKGTLKKPRLTIFSEPAMAESDALSYLLFGRAASQAMTTEGQSSQNTAAAMGFVAGDILSQEIGGRLGLDEMRVDVGETTAKTALVLGKYLSPKLYVRYLSGIIESSNIVQLRYRLSDRLQIQTEGGYRGSQSVTGGDIIFTIEY